MPTEAFGSNIFSAMKRIRKVTSTVLPLLRNKYVFTSLLFVVWMMFIDENNVISQVKNRLKLAELEKDREFYEHEISESTADLKLLQHDREVLEKFAREKYLMKKADEDIFVFVTEE